jgi:hypothetical protein
MNNTSFSRRWGAGLLERYQSFERGLALREDVVSISNRGDIQTVSSDIGAGLLTIRWIPGP